MSKSAQVCWQMILQVEKRVSEREREREVEERHRRERNICRRKREGERRMWVGMEEKRVIIEHKTM